MAGSSSYGRLRQVIATYFDLRKFKPFQLIFKTFGRKKLDLMHFLTQNEEKSKNEIDTHQKILEWSDK